MHKGINGWTFPAGTPWASAARQAREAGFACLEPILAAEGELTPETGEAECRALGEAIRAAGVQITALASGLFWQTPLTSPDPATREAAHSLAVAALDRARWLGADVLLMVPGVVGKWNAREPMCRYEDALAWAGEALRALSFEAEARNVTLAIENLWNRFLLSPAEMRELIDHVNSSWVRVCLDVGNVMKFGYPQDWILSLGPRIVRVHVRDYKLDAGTNHGFCLPGEGDVDWPAVMAALHEAGYDGPVTYEGRGELNEIARRLGEVVGV